MKIRELIFIVIGLILLIAFVSGRSESSALRKQTKTLQTQVAQLSAEVQKYKNSPDRLLAQADEYYKQKDVKHLEVIHSKLEKYHRSSKEYTEVGQYITTLKDAEAKRIAAEKEAKLKAVKRLRKKLDDVSGITWYQNPYFTHYNNSNHISIYIGKSDNSVWLRLKMSYYGDDWIFFKSAYLSYDGNTIEIPFNDYKDKETENSTSVWEWIDVSLSDSQIDFLKKFVNGKSLKMRLTGKYTKTKIISSSERKALKDVLLGYEVLKKEMNQL